VKGSNLSAENAFKFFDQDFDGLISKQDMKLSLEKFLNIAPSKINDHRIDRLFRVLSFYKMDTLQPSDFERLLSNENPFLSAC
jgi:Ca2+-binding EF-hand superfamily protein